MEQRTEEWFEKRLGKVTASRISDVMAKGRSGAESATRENYKAQLILERLNGVKQESFTNDAMKWGTEKEPDAIAVYEFVNNVNIELIDFVNHKTILMAGASPDGRIGTDGLIEIKCPNSATHLDALTKGNIADKYIKQMQWQMACDGREWCDFVSYDPRFPTHLQLWQKRIFRDNELIIELEKAVMIFLDEINNALITLNDLDNGNN